MSSKKAIYSALSLFFLLWFFSWINIDGISSFLENIFLFITNDISSFLNLLIAGLLLFITYKFNKFQETSTKVNIEDNRPILIPIDDWNIMLENNWKTEAYDIRIYVKTDQDDFPRLIYNSIPSIYPGWKYSISIEDDLSSWKYRSIIVLYKNAVSWFEYVLWFNHFWWNISCNPIWFEYVDKVMKRTYLSPISKWNYFDLISDLSLYNQIENWKHVLDDITNLIFKM